MTQQMLDAQRFAQRTSPNGPDEIRERRILKIDLARINAAHQKACAEVEREYTTELKVIARLHKLALKDVASARKASR